MTTYYGVWSDWSGRDGKEWWQIGGGLFYTPILGIARAQARVTNAIWKRGPAYGTRKDEQWKVRVIGEDGLPKSEPANQPTFEIKREFLQCKMARCAMCGEPAKEWVDVRIKGWMCEQHSHVSVGCFSEKEEA